MIEYYIKAATCRVSCSDESGTGWLVRTGLVITARHCVRSALLEGKPIELFFPDNGEAPVFGTIMAQSEENDVCLLSFDAARSAEPLPGNFQRPREGGNWQTFGYPNGKTILGHRLSGTVAQVLNTPKLGVDLDLFVDPAVALRDYRGLSGAAVVCEGAAVGMIRLKIDGTVAALSLRHLESFLTENGVAFPSESSAPAPPLLADRGAFAEAFAETVRDGAGSYLFLQGAHGYGKSTFSANFQTDDKALINLGAYRLSEPDSALGADYWAQPQVFFDWLATKISGQIIGQLPRKEEKSYAELIRQTAQCLDAFSAYCAKTERRGLLFIDGLNEVPAGNLLGELVGLLPRKLPPQVTVVPDRSEFFQYRLGVGCKSEDRKCLRIAAASRSFSCLAPPNAVCT
jgi:hypothetical protein